MRNRPKPKENQLAGYIVSLIVDCGLIYALNRIPSWNLPFITGTFPAVIWPVGVALTVQAALNAALIFYHPLFFHYLGTAVIGAASIVGLVVFAQVFPLDISSVAGLSNQSWLNSAGRVVLIVAAAATAIAVVVNIVKFFARVITGNVEN